MDEELAWWQWGDDTEPEETEDLSMRFAASVSALAAMIGLTLL